MSLTKREKTMGRAVARSRWVVSAVILAALTIMGAPVRAAAAMPGFGFESFDATALNADHHGETQAGAHPVDATVRFKITSDQSRFSIKRLKHVDTDLPPGLIGNPTATPRCLPIDFNALNCPVATQVGIVGLAFAGVLVTKGLYNLVPEDGTVAQFGFALGGTPVILTAHVRPDDFGITVSSDDVPEAADVPMVSVQLWGAPADGRHDALRSGGLDCSGDLTEPTSDGICDRLPVGSRAGVTSVAFVSNPTDCSAGPFTTRISGSSWANPEIVKTVSVLSHDDAVPSNPVGVTGCDKLGFSPSVSAQPASTQPDTPTGLDVKLSFPTDGLTSPGGLAEPPLKKAVVTLPEGMTINPASAGGLSACSDSEIGLRTDSAVSCPDGSKIGTVTASTPVLAEQLSGSLYLRSQASDDPESGDMFRVVLVLKSEKRGLLFKLPGSIRADKTTGRLTTTFDNNPQVPVSELSLHFKGGARATLATPPTCGEKTIDAQLTSWAGQTVTRHDSFTVPCTAGLGGFAPTLTAGAVSPVGGAFSPFGLSISKPDGNADLTGLTMQLPQGLTAKLAGNLGSQVGTATTFAGPGSNPYPFAGKVYLEGAYGDAPFSLRVEVPAKAGPFDLGTVTVRQKIYVDPITAQVTIVSDPLPTIVSGVPVRLQRLDVNIDKAGFMINPTSCAPKAISGTLGAVDGQTAAINVRFQVGDCSALALKPALGLTLSGKGQTTDGKHPAVSADLTQAAGQANLKKVRVALPLSLALDPDNANGLCEFADGSKATPTCSKNSIVGTATATTPILDEPLTGPVYFVKNERKDPKSGRSIKTLPKLVIPLTGQNGLKLTLTGTSDVVDDQLVTTFDNVPDAPVSSFKLSIIGGKGGILTVSGADICKATQIADQQINGQNNKTANTDVYIQTPSCPTKIISKKITAKTVVFKVGGLGAGKVTITGHGIRKTTKTISKSSVATITAKRTKGKPGAFKVKFTKAKAPVA